MDAIIDLKREFNSVTWHTCHISLFISVDFVFFAVAHDLADGYGSLQVELGLARVLIFPASKLLCQYGIAAAQLVSV